MLKTKKRIKNMENMESPSALEINEIEKIEFKNGDNILKLMLFEKLGKRYLKIILNDELEIKQTAFTSPNLALNHFKMLKNYLK